MNNGSFPESPARSNAGLQFDYAGINRSITPSAVREDVRQLLERKQGGQEDQQGQESEQDSIGPLTTWRDTRAITESVSWAWESWLPNGFVTMVAAESGQGKSIVVLWLAGLFTTGNPFPTSESDNGKPGNVLWIETEHAQAMNIDRLAKFGLDDAAFLNPLPNPLDTVQLENLEHREMIRKRAMLPEVALIVVDSLSGSHRLKENSTEMIEITDFLARLAQESNKPVIVVHHFNKLPTDGNLPSLSKIRGSSSIVQFCRMVWAIDTPNAADTDLKRLSVIKSNLASWPDPIGFRIGEDRIEFTDAPQADKRKTQQGKAVEWLVAQLQNGPVPQKELEQRGEEEGISFRTLKRAKEEIGVKSRKRKEGWYWELPMQGDHNSPQQNAGLLGPLGLLDGKSDTEPDDLFGGGKE